MNDHHNSVATTDMNLEHTLAPNVFTNLHIDGPTPTQTTLSTTLVDMDLVKYNDELGSRKVFHAKEVHTVMGLCLRMVKHSAQSSATM